MYGLNKHRNGGPPQRGLIRAGVRKFAGGVGLASEAVKDRKASKTSQNSSETEGSESYGTTDERHISNPTVSGFGGALPAYADSEGKDRQASEKKASYLDSSVQHSTADEDDLEAEWKLDDAQDEIIGQVSTGGSSTEPEEDVFLRHCPPPSYTPAQQRGRLTFPVVLPQRRPANRSRGFIRAYAPVLENCNIDQPTWIAFLEAFQKDSAASPWLNAINLAAIGTIWLPHFAAQAVGFAISQIANIAIELQSRERYDTRKETAFTVC